MPESLSPKKYIETKVRSLPIYKCIVNADWKESGLANIIVLRKHVNGHVTAGIYLVDLQCLGVKDTMWFFNEDEVQMMKRFTDIPFAPAMETVDYELAHNIIYAGHDFAMDYDIHPHPDFKTTHFILEEDDEKIPIVDIKTGYGEDGIPHLMAKYPGQYADALAKLKKNAGDGKFLYTVGMFDDDEDEDGDDDDFDGDEDEENDGENGEDDDWEENAMPLSDFEEGELTLENVQDIRSDDLADDAQLAKRSIMEQMICITEIMLRSLPDEVSEIDFNWADTEWMLADDMLPSPNLISEADYEEWTSLLELHKNEIIESGDNADDFKKVMHMMAINYGHNPLMVIMLISEAIAGNNIKAAEYLAKWKPQHGQIPLFRLLEAFNGVMQNDNLDAHDLILNNNNLKDAFPTFESFSLLEFGIFHALHTIKNARLSNLEVAIEHYYLTATTDMVHILYLPMMAELLPLLQAKLAQEDDEETGTEGEV